MDITEAKIHVKHLHNRPAKVRSVPNPQKQRMGWECETKKTNTKRGG